MREHAQATDHGGSVGVFVDISVADNEPWSVPEQTD
jgi:hypothetical protein